MDVTALLNTSGSLPAGRRAPSSESPAITYGHTAPSSVLPTPSPDRILAPSESETGKASHSPWGGIDYHLRLSVEAKFPRGSALYSFDRKIESEPSYETQSTLYGGSRNSSVYSREDSMPSTSQYLKTTAAQWARDKHKALECKRLPDRNNIETHALGPSGFATTSHSPTDMHRPMSPSDAVLQMRGQNMSAADDRSTSSHGVTVPTKAHKRTMTAPDIAQISVARIAYHQKLSRLRSTEAIEEMIEETLPEGNESPEPASVGSQNAYLDSEKEAYCVFVKDCDTGSQLRKVISHLFGRNKACTLRIPKHVWVYYCRKHYQRIRYRHAKTYPLNQMELVKLQILRLREWSDENQKRRSGPYIKQWMLSLRKREQNRIENGGAGEGGHNDGRTPAGTAVPEWLIQRVGSGCTTEEIMDVASRLHAEIKDDVLSQVPEIEFLPDIVDAGSGTSKKAVRSRKQTRPTNGPRTPKRKAPEARELCRRSSNMSEGHYGEYYNGEETYEVVTPSGKRARAVRGPLPPHVRRESSQQPSLASALSGAEMHPPPPGPPRGPNVVPRIQPVEYRRGSVQGGPRRESYDSHAHSAYSVHCSQGDYWYGSSYSMGPPQSLPPKSAQLEGRFPRQPERAPENPFARPSHVRSASAYAPANRTWQGQGRPSSSGDEVLPYADHRYEAAPHEAVLRHAREYEQGYSYAWSGHHQAHPSQAPPMRVPRGYVPRHAGPPQPYAAGHPHSWARDARPV